MKFTIAIAAICAVSQAGDCNLDEANNWMGAGLCWFNDDECQGVRYCNEYLMCAGESNCDDTSSVEGVEQLQDKVDGLEQKIQDLKDELHQMLGAFESFMYIDSDWIDVNELD